MCRQGSKVFTDFMIETPGERLRCLDTEIDFADRYYPEIWSRITDLFSDLRHLDCYKKLSDREQTILEYYSMLNVFSRGIYTANGRIVDVTEECPNVFIVIGLTLYNLFNHLDIYLYFRLIHALSSKIKDFTPCYSYLLNFNPASSQEYDS